MGARCDKDHLVDRLLDAHRAWFDVERDHEFCGRTFPGYAEYHAHAESYVLVRRAKLWEVDAHQYLFFDTVDRLDEGLLDEMVEFMRMRAIGKVDPKPDHMSSDLGLVIVADSVDDAAADKLARTRYRKNFRLGLRGWSDLKLAVVDLAGRRVVTNGAGADMRKTLETRTWGIGTEGERPS